MQKPKVVTTTKLNTKQSVNPNTTFCGLFKDFQGMWSLAGASLIPNNTYD